MAKKILVVDDEPHIVKLLQARLEKNGYNGYGLRCGFLCAKAI